MRARRTRPAEDRGLELLEVGGPGFPALVIENGQVAGGVAGRVGQGGDQPAEPVACPALVVKVISASMTRTGMPPKRDSHDPSGRRCRTGSFGELFPVRTRIRKSASVAAICAARKPAPKFRSASRTIPACRLPSRLGA